MWDSEGKGDGGFWGLGVCTLLTFETVTRLAISLCFADLPFSVHQSSGSVCVFAFDVYS